MQGWSLPARLAAIGRRHGLRVPVGGLLLASLVAGEERGLFLPVESEAKPASASAPLSPASASVPDSGLASDIDLITLRQRLVSIDFAQITPPVGSPGAAPADGPSSGVLQLNLFDDVSFTAIVERVSPTFSGGYSLSGRLSGEEMGMMTLVVNGAVVAGTIRTAETVYRIRAADAGLHLVSQINTARLPPLGDPIPARDRKSRLRRHGGRDRPALPDR